MLLSLYRARTLDLLLSLYRAVTLKWYSLYIGLERPPRFFAWGQAFDFLSLFTFISRRSLPNRVLPMSNPLLNSYLEAAFLIEWFRGPFRFCIHLSRQSS